MKRTTLPSANEALPGHEQAIQISEPHAVLQTPITPPYPEGCEQILFGMGCFWGAEKCFWQLDGIHTTAVGYAAGITANPRYEEVCSGLTGHNEVVLVVYHPEQRPLSQLLKTFWEGHDPTQGMRQGNDIGTQYRSGIYCFNDLQLQQAETSMATYQATLSQSGKGKMTTEILPYTHFYFAESYHQQYLAKNPSGYCGLGGLAIPYFDERDK